jgi:hypothetical protein
LPTWPVRLTVNTAFAGAKNKPNAVKLPILQMTQPTTTNEPTNAKQKEANRSYDPYHFELDKRQTFSEHNRHSEQSESASTGEEKKGK